MNALSLPTWVVHISSVIEWTIAILLIQKYSLRTGDRGWYWLGMAMLPALVSALCACTWHLFDNAPQMEWLVTVQSATTLGGNICLALAGRRLYRQLPNH
jgi:cytochrome b